MNINVNGTFQIKTDIEIQNADIIIEELNNYIMNVNTEINKIVNTSNNIYLQIDSISVI